MLATEREREDVIEALGAVAGFAHETLESTLKILHGGAWRDVAEEVPSEDAFFRQPRETRFVIVILLDISVVIDGNKSEWQLVNFAFGEFEKILGIDHGLGSAFPRAGGSLVTEWPIPRGLGSDDIDRLSAEGRVEAIARRGVVPLDGPTLVIVISGYFRIFRNAAFVRDVTLGLAARGDVLASSAAFGERPAETGAEALTEGHVLLLGQEAWQRCAALEPDLNLKMAASIARRIMRLQKKLEELSRSGVESRVAGSILELADDFGQPVAGGVKLDVPLSQEDLARLAGTTRETCSSTVAEFARRGLVRGGRLRGLVVLDRAGLGKIANASL